MRQRVSIYTWFGYYMPIAERLRLIKEAGFDSVMTWWEDGAGDDTGVLKEEVSGLARAAGLGIEYVHAPFYEADHIWTGDQAASALEKMYLGLIDHCGDVAIPAIVLHPAKVPQPHPVTQSGLDMIARLLERAERRNVGLAFENLDSVAHLDAIFGSLKSGKLGFCFDSGHHNVTSAGKRDLLADFGDKLIALHLHDNDGKTDLHKLPGDGEIDWDDFKTSLAATGYRGPIMLEVLCDNYADKSDVSAEEFLHKAYERACMLRYF